MNTDSSITAWIWQIKDHDENALQKIWNRYLTDLHRVATNKLQGWNQHFGGAEDAVSEAMASFFFGVTTGKFPQLNDRTDLWPLLVTITKNKAKDFIRKEQAKRRPQFVNPEKSSNCDESEFMDVIGAGPTPDEVVSTGENMVRLLNLLRDDLRKTALQKLEGLTNSEIAKNQGLEVRAVERRLQMIRAIWTKDAVIQEFCDLWSTGETPAIQETYENCADDFTVVARQVRRDLLIQLIKHDVEFRWANRDEYPEIEQLSTRQYIEDFPELEVEKTLSELLCHEYRVRHEFGDHVSKDDLLIQNSIEDPILAKKIHRALNSA